MTMAQVDESTIWDALREVHDPELPVINVVDLGVIRQVRLGDPIVVELMPTFVGCPAIEMMKRDVAKRLSEFGDVEVHVIYDEPWTSDRISEAGREMLHSAGFAPPPLLEGAIRLIPVSAEAVACPYCGSTKTHLENLFGPTPCRSIYYCDACRQPFERFKAV